MCQDENAGADLTGWCRWRGAARCEGRSPSPRSTRRAGGDLLRSGQLGPTLYFHASRSKELAQPSPAVSSVSPTLLSALPNTVPLSGEVLYLAILWLEKGSVLSDRQMHESAEKVREREGWSHPPLSH